MSGLDQLRAALAIKQGLAPSPNKRVPVPDPIVYATEGTHKARDGYPYTITYDKALKQCYGVTISKTGLKTEPKMGS